MVTDVDLLAFRFPRSDRRVVGAPAGRPGAVAFEVDPELGVPPETADMLIGEVKEGRAEFNPATREPEVLKATLVRFGCCSDERVDGTVDRLLRDGHATLPNGHRIRMVAFGGRVGDADRAVASTVSLGHVADFLRSYLSDHWDVLRHAQFKDSTLGFLMALEKARR